MMVRSLVDEVVRRRLWPIPLLALIIAVAAPVLFMKSAPPGAPDGSAAPPVAAPGELPSGAQKLMTTSDKAVVPKRKPTKKGQDPFAPPASGAKPAGAATAATSAPVDGATAPPAVPVVINNSDGSTTTATVTPSTGSAPKTTTSAPKTTTEPKATTPKVDGTPKATAPKTTAPAAAAARKVTYVDVRFGRKLGTMLRYRIPRLQSFRAAGKVAAMYVGYSRKRKVVVFAVAPSTKVSGDVRCRTVDSVCRFVDLAVGQYARLAMIDDDGTKISRRLDVVSVRRIAETGPAKTAPLATTRTAANCLMKRLLALPASAPSISADSCD
jgi:hypothetical protein